MNGEKNFKSGFEVIIYSTFLLIPDTASAIIYRSTLNGVKCYKTLLVVCLDFLSPHFTSLSLQ